MKNILYALLATAALALSVTAQSAKTFEVPFTMDRNLMIVRGKLNNRQVQDFIFDTGTNGIVLSESAAAKFGLKSKGFATMGSINGETSEKVKKTVVYRLGFSGFDLRNSPAVIIKDEAIFSPNAAGIVGLSAFNGYLVTIDHKNSKLIFKKGNLKPGANTIRLNDAPILEAQIELNGTKVPAHFDSGAPGYIAIPKEWTSYKLKSEPVRIGRGRTPMSEFDVFEADFAGEITIGQLVLKDPKITLLTGKFPAVNLGYKFFKQYKITIDFKNKLMRVEPNS